VFAISVSTLRGANSKRMKKAAIACLTFVLSMAAFSSVDAAAYQAVGISVQGSGFCMPRGLLQSYVPSLPSKGAVAYKVGVSPGDSSYFGGGISWSSPTFETYASCEDGYVIDHSSFGSAVGVTVYFSYELDDTTSGSSVPLVLLYGTAVWNGTTWVSNLNWGALYISPLFATNSPAIAASSSLWSAYTASSTLSQLQNCALSGNIFSEAICSAVAYLFVPDPNVLNQWASFPGYVSGFFPFSWVAGVQTSVNGLVASSTSNMIDLSFDYPALGVGSTSPLGLANIAPKIDVFSTSTIEHYIGSTYWALFQSLIAVGIWLTFIADVFFTARNQMHRV